MKQGTADNALLLVVALRDHGRLRVADAARLLSVTPPTAHRLLATLKRHQFAEQDHSRAYLPGPRLQDLSAAGRHELAAVSRPFLTELAATTGETVHLVTLEGNGCRFLGGPLLPAHTTAGGKVLLAQLPESDLLALYPDRKITLRDGTVRDLSSLRRELGRVRRGGYALDLETSERGVNAVGAPITGHDGRVTAAVVVACQALRSGRTRLIDLVPLTRRTADAIGAAQE